MLYLTVYALITILVVCIVGYLYNKTLLEDNQVDIANIRKWAKRDLSVLGDYSYRLGTSVHYWVHAIEVFLYDLDITDGVYDALLRWNADCNRDGGTIILRGIESAHTQFLAEVDEGRDKKIDPKFKCDREYDYHVLPKTLMYNDYIDTEALIDKVDNLVKMEKETANVGL